MRKNRNSSAFAILCHICIFASLDFRKKGKDAARFINGDNTMLALALTFQKEPDARVMCFLRDYAERYDWLVQAFQDWSFTFLSSFLFYEDYDEMEEENREIYRAGTAAFEGIAPEYHIELKDRPTMVWDFHSLLLAIQMMSSFMLVDETAPHSVRSLCRAVCRYNPLLCYETKSVSYKTRNSWS